jgi:cyanophycin synthetase
MSSKNRLVKEHISRGGRAIVLEKSINGQMLTLYDNYQHIPILYAHLIPATLEGRVRFNIANAMAAAAITYSLGVSVETIRQALQTFATSYHQVPGRMNIFDECGFRVIVDYGHNRAALTAMTEVVKSMRRGRSIGVIAAPGDRRDEDLLELGRLAAGMFQEIVVKESTDLRGRKPGETASLLRQGAINGGCLPEKITLILNEPGAVHQSLSMARQNDLVVIFAVDVDAVWNQVVAYRKIMNDQNGNGNGGSHANDGHRSEPVHADAGEGEPIGAGANGRH